ncbi:PepSY domain-containing protein [Emticicia sp. TH156]|uniref:PepSY-associated TM helix domain-containing protein n=1 Tax=Emticicia sp. TH156 TaxID=2067454 RepID=UPI000C78175E|nr:PepSY-associated TM helix domain-containing protein [Emticicia sp. TH156]PLK46374.1 PepSY domain-containing protein [Emticicia sp. TH156]
MAKKNNGIKYWLGKIHLWGGLVSGIVVFIVSITGCLFVFEEEIRDLTLRKYRFVEPSKSARVSLATIETEAKRAFPDKKIDQVRVFSDATRAVIVKLADAKAKPAKGNKEEKEYRKEAFGFNPYTGALLGRYNLEYDFMHLVEDTHKSLLLGETGKWIIKINVVVFLVMLLSGLYLWWPRKRNQRRFAFTVNFKSKFQVLNYSLHNVLGFYFLLPLFVITMTGIWWAIKPVQKITYAALGQKMPEQKKTISIYQPGKVFSPDDALSSVALAYGGWKEAHINFAKNDKETIKVNLKYPYQIYKKSNVFEFDQYSGAVLKTELFKDYSTADKLKHSNRDLHTGQNFGFAGKLLAFIASLFAASLPVTGFLIWYQRKYKKVSKKVSSAKKNQLAMA